MADNPKLHDSHSSTELLPRQAEFVRAYLSGMTATDAAKAAGYSAKSAGSLGYQLLNNPRIRAHLRGISRKRAAMADLKAATVLQHAQRQAFADPRWYVDANGDPIPVQELSDEAAAALQGLEMEQTPRGMRLKYRLVDKGAATERVMRHLGLFEADNRQSSDPVSQLLQAIHAQGSKLPLAE